MCALDSFRGSFSGREMTECATILRERARGLISLENDSVNKSAAGFISISTLGREGQDGVVAFFRGDCHCASMFRGRAANKE